ncbi:MAG: hypothetical protein QW429_06905 [Thermoprotei archaeon]
MCDMFLIDRGRELSALEDRFSSDKFEFTVVYGRRRTGKTPLLLGLLGVGCTTTISQP